MSRLGLKRPYFSREFINISQPSDGRMDRPASRLEREYWKCIARDKLGLARRHSMVTSISRRQVTNLLTQIARAKFAFREVRLAKYQQSASSHFSHVLWWTSFYDLKQQILFEPTLLSQDSFMEKQINLARVKL
jgi:hypothetical protein